jgi:transcriptional regulator of met regulon
MRSEKRANATSRVGASAVLAKELSRLREKLLDLTLKNPLLNFKHSRGRLVIRVIDEVPNQIYGRLDEDKAFRFRSLGDRVDEPPDESTIEFRRALEAARLEDPEYVQARKAAGDDPGDRVLDRLERELRDRLRTRLGMPPRPTSAGVTAEEIAKRRGLNPSFELPAEITDKRRHQDDCIQTMLFEEELDPRLSLLAARTRSSLEERGINPLFCSLGFLEWFAREDAEEPLHAPLLLFPLEISRDHGGRREYCIRSSREGIIVNPALAEKLRRDFGVELPEWDDENGNPEAYWSSVLLAVRHLKGWKIRRWLTVGLFSFAKVAMWRDLDPSNWTEIGEAPARGQLVRLLCGGSAAAEASCEAHSELIGQEPCGVVDPGRHEMDTPLVTDADSSQLEVIRHVLAGQSLVVVGPPGTGKSQTITNIIGAAMRAGKSILFVAEKMAALNVVHKRLMDAGLDMFCLELHSTKAGRRETYQAIARRLAARGGTSSVSELDAVRRELDLCRREMKRITDALAQPAGNLRGTIQELVWRVEALRVGLRVSLAGIEEPWVRQAASWTDVEVAKAVETAQEYATNRLDIVQAYGSVRRCPWYGLARPDLDLLTQETLRSRVRSLAAAAERALRCGEHVHDLTGWRPPTIDDLKLARIDAPDPCADELMVSRLADHRTYSLADAFVRDVEALRALKARLRSSFTGEPYAPAEAIRKLAIDSSGLFPTSATVGDIPRLTGLLKEEANRIGRAARLLDRIRKSFPDRGWEQDHDAEEAIVTAVKLAAAGGAEVRAGRLAALMAEDAISVIEKAMRARDELVRRRELLAKTFFIDEAPSAIELAEHAKAAMNAPFIAVLSRSYRAAKRVWRGLCRPPRKGGRAAIFADLNSLAAWRREEDQYVNTYAALFGGGGHGACSPKLGPREISVFKIL